MKIMGMRESKGEYEGHVYHNFVLQCLEPMEMGKGIGANCVQVKVPASVFADFLGGYDGQVDKLLGVSIGVSYDRYGKVVALTPASK